MLSAGIALSQSRPKNPFAALQGHKYISLTNFRKSGKAVATPVQFAEKNDKLYVWTRAKSGKVKRIRNNPHVQLAPCAFRGKIDGPTIGGMAHILTADEEAPAQRAIRNKYGWQIRIGTFVSKLRREKRVYLEIVPAPEKK